MQFRRFLCELAFVSAVYTVSCDVFLEFFRVCMPFASACAVIQACSDSFFGWHSGVLLSSRWLVYCFFSNSRILFRVFLCASLQGGFGDGTSDAVHGNTDYVMGGGLAWGGGRGFLTVMMPTT